MKSDGSNPESRFEDLTFEPKLLENIRYRGKIKTKAEISLKTNINPIRNLTVQTYITPSLIELKIWDIEYNSGTELNYFINKRYQSVLTIQTRTDSERTISK